MSSWRDETSVEAQEQLDALLSVTLGFAQQELGEHGEFFPFAAAIGEDGRARMIAGRPAGGGDAPSSADVLAACVAALADQREEIRAAAVASDVATPAGDAIRVELEHAEGRALAVLLPYTRSAGGGLSYGQIQAQSGRPQVWVDA